jgi:hypothetical protein
LRPDVDEDLLNLGERNGLVLSPIAEIVAAAGTDLARAEAICAKAARDEKQIPIKPKV